MLIRTAVTVFSIAMVACAAHAVGQNEQSEQKNQEYLFLGVSSIESSDGATEARGGVLRFDSTEGNLPERAMSEAGRWLDKLRVPTTRREHRWAAAVHDVKDTELDMRRIESSLKELTIPSNVAFLAIVPKDADEDRLRAWIRPKHAARTTFRLHFHGSDGVRLPGGTLNIRRASHMSESADNVSVEDGDVFRLPRAKDPMPRDGSFAGPFEIGVELPANAGSRSGDFVWVVATTTDGD